MSYFKFKELKEPISTSEQYYDFFDGGYICPFDMLEDDEQLQELVAAKRLIEQFFDEAVSAGVLEIE